MKTGLTACLFFFFLFFSCRNDNSPEKPVVKPGKDEMADLNRYLVQKDREVIENYIVRKNLKMTESPTGLWYSVGKEGNGEYLKDNDRIYMEYDCSLLDGTLCYSSAELGPKEIVLGKTDLEQGINEGLRLLKFGAEAIFIMPPFLAYGLVGDGKKIPPRVTIVYRVRIPEKRK
jgi:FKBP-type peptidyl-prolyl cis-trans isomerase FkpA